MGAKTAVITGGSGGIGAAIVRALVREGWRVVFSYLTGEECATALSKELGAVSICCDVTVPESVDRLIEAAGDVGLLVNNAGIALSGLLTDNTDGDNRRVVDVNLFGAINCCRAAIPHMVRRKSGIIINISSVWGISGASFESVYAASKSGLIGLTLSLAKELGSSGVRVNCVAPGVIDTAMLSGYSACELSWLSNQTPLGRLGTPDDVAEIIAFLASERAGFITGQVIAVDGGFAL